MTSLTKSSTFLIAAGFGLTALAGCASHAPTSTPPEYLEGTTLTRHEIGVQKRTEFLEVDIDPVASQLTLKDRARIEAFVYAYRARGHGPLIMSLPTSSANPQLAVAAVAEARAIAYENGLSYNEIAGNTHGGDTPEPMIIAFQAYDAIKPNCKSLANYDFSDASSNNDMPSLGCAVRSNMAAMIADPGDLLGGRPLGEGDALRREVILDKFREGVSTGSARSAEESGAVSDAVGN